MKNRKYAKKMVYFKWENLAPTLLLILLAVLIIGSIEMNNQTGSNVLAHCGRLGQGWTRAGEGPVTRRCINSSEAVCFSSGGWLYPDFVGG